MVYIFSKFTAKPANKQFTSLNHDYELSFTNDTQVTPCLDSDATEIPNMSFNFMEIAFIENCEKDKIVGMGGNNAKSQKTFRTKLKINLFLFRCYWSL